MLHRRTRIAFLKGLVAALASTAGLLVLGAGSAHAQYMSCETFMALDKPQRHLYLTGYVEGISYTQLELAQLVKMQAQQKDLKDEQKLALSVMSRVADNIGQDIPNGLTVEQVTDKLEELCTPAENKRTAFVNVYSQYSTALRQAAIVRMQQQAEQQKGAAAADPKAAPAAPAAPTKDAVGSGEKPKPAAAAPATAPAPGAGTVAPNPQAAPAAKPAPAPAKP